MSALAQDATTPPAPEATPPAAVVPSPSPSGHFFLEVDANDLQAISVGLNELPKKIADPLILKLNAQLQAQQQQQIAANKDAADKATKKAKK